MSYYKFRTVCLCVYMCVWIYLSTIHACMCAFTYFRTDFLQMWWEYMTDHYGMHVYLICSRAMRAHTTKTENSIADVTRRIKCVFLQQKIWMPQPMSHILTSFYTSLLVNKLMDWFKCNLSVYNIMFDNRLSICTPRYINTPINKLCVLYGNSNWICLKF
jgi:hypothetical protein